MNEPAKETSRLEVEPWTRGPELLLSDDAVHHLFERAAAARPDADALRYEGGTLSYAALNRQANRLAHHLVRRGVRVGDRVGICLERAPELVVALLAVMKAGGAYVALEPELPRDRLSFIARNAASPLVISDSNGESLLAGHDFQLVDVQAGVDESESNLDLDIDGAHLIYVLYTSGSTGDPKGVMVPHRSVVNHVQWLVDGCGVTSADVFLLKSPFGFDMSVSELFGPLCTGGVMAIARPEAERDPSYLLGALDRFGVTCLRVVPTTLNLLLTEDNAASGGTALRWVMLGGEALTPAVRDRFFDTFPHAELHNPFGITETCVDVTYWICPKERRGQEVSLGTPMGNYQVYLLDDRQDLVKGTEIGELCVGGVGVSYGYWRQPGRTAEKFVPDPFGASGSRLYRSGDKARWDERRELRYHGRNDDQVQLNGIRVEYGEVEAFLESAPGVQQAAVRGINEENGRAEGLVAFVVAEGAGIDISAIGAFLETKLRRGVIPTRYVVLDELPRKPSGKVDRRALVIPTPRRVPTIETMSAALFTPTQLKLRTMWIEVLENRDISLDANFFEVGGTSLKAINIHRLIKSEFGVDLQVVELFQHTTIRKLAEFIDGQPAGSGEDIEEKQSRADRRRGALRRTRELRRVGSDDKDQ